jgi:hypothetical protein
MERCGEMDVSGHEERGLWLTGLGLPGVYGTNPQFALDMDGTLC